jgi:hypothetical protein
MLKMRTFVGIKSTFYMLCNIVNAEEVQELANRSAFSAQIVSDGVLEEDSLIYYTVFRHKSDHFMQFNKAITIGKKGQS